MALLQTINSMALVAYLGVCPRNYKPAQLLIENRLNEITIEKGIEDIELMKGPFVIHRYIHCRHSRRTSNYPKK